jgi:autoinducer 2-degrading protein
MYALVVTIHIKPEYRQPFIEAMLDDARNSVQNEPGCLLFNVVQDEADPNCIYLYEVYRNAQAFEHHTQTPHFIRWVDTTKDWFAQPVIIGKGNHLSPPDELWKKQT